MNPNAIPLLIEYPRIMKMIVTKPLAAKIKLSHLISFNCEAIKIPTITNAGAVTASVIIDNTG